MIPGNNIKQPALSIIIPFFNEEENIYHLTSELNKYINKLNNLSIEVIFIDDGSTDKSLEILKGERINSYKTKVIKLSRNFGSHAAIRAGILNSTGNYITIFYADLQDPLELMKELYNKCLEGYDIVWAERKDTNVSFFEKIFSLFYAKLMRKFVSENYPLKGFDIVIFNEKVRKELNNNIESNSSFVLQILTMGFKQTSLLYNKQKRKYGKSKWTLGKKIKIFIDSFIAYSFTPIRFVSILGIIFFIIGTIWTLYILFRELFIGDLTPGWPALISILLIGFGITNISLGIIAEYLWRTLDVARNRPVFIIDEIIEINNGK